MLVPTRKKKFFTMMALYIIHVLNLFFFIHIFRCYFRKMMAFRLGFIEMVFMAWQNIQVLKRFFKKGPKNG